MDGGSFLLKLSVALTFSPTGSFQGIFFSHFQLTDAACLVQDFSHMPELSFWRGFGANFASGLPYSLFPVIEAHT